MPPATSVSARDRMPFGALLVLSMIGFTAITTELLPSGLLPQISAGLNVSEPVAGYLTAGYAAVIVATVIPAAMLLSRIPRHILLVALVLTFAISNALVGLVSDFGAALAARLVGGIAHGLLWTAMAPFVARIVPAHKVGKAMAIVFSGNSLGLAIGAPLGTALGAADRLAGVLPPARGRRRRPRGAWPCGCCPPCGGSRTPRGRRCARRSASPA